MALPKTILVPTDFSEPANKALGMAIELAQRLDARLVLLHSWELPIGGYETAFVFTPEVILEIENDAQKRLDEARARAAAAKVPVTTHIRRGEARAMILEQAKELPADLIVMGTHGRKGVPRWLLGSIAEHVVRLSACPVLTVRP